MILHREHAMKTLKKLDLAAEEEQLRLVKKLRDEGDPRHRLELDKFNQMIAEKTLEYYCEDGYHAFFEHYAVDYETDDGYKVEVRGHEMSVSKKTAYGNLTGCGSTWDYITGDLRVTPKPSDMDKKEYAAIKQRMEDIQESERVVYPFHSLHRIGSGYFDTKICMFNAHKLVKGKKQ
ncbi:MAG: hypothetical protein JW864_07520 [Spirochaetes bacterium]|nr:hypothetical protein [Spirochaetota bacterium]